MHKITRVSCAKSGGAKSPMILRIVLNWAAGESYIDTIK